MWGKSSDAGVVALYSNVSTNCNFFEMSKPYAELDIYYVQDGSYTIATTTGTDCADLAEISVAMIGERVIFNDARAPVAVRRENGRTYRVATRVSRSPTDRDYFRYASLQGDMERKKRPYVGALHEQLDIRRVSEVAEQCQLLREQEDHDACLVLLAGVDLDAKWCHAIKDGEFRDRCTQWIGDLTTAVPGREEGS